MFSGLLKEITGALDRRFVLTLFFPSLLFWAALLVVYAATGDMDALVTSWRTQSTERRALQIVGAVAWVLFFSYMLWHQVLWITRQFEGYWDWPLGNYLRRVRTRHYLRVLNSLNPNDDTAYERIYYGFPLPDEPEHVMPTRLGNILKNAELYPKRQYAADAVLFWPRLYAVVPDSFTATVGEAKSSLDLMLVLSALSAVFAIIAGVGLLIRGGPWWLFLACFGGGLLAAHFAYISALRAAIPYTQLIKSAFDLYRGDLIDKLGYERPKSLDDENSFWENLGQQLYRGTPQDEAVLRYKVAEEKRPPAPEAPAVASQDAAIQTLTEHDAGEETGEMEDKQKAVVLALAILAAAGGSWFLRRHSQSINVPVAVRGLPAYTQISRNDLKYVVRSSYELPRDVIVKPETLDGRYLRQPIAAGRAIRSSQLVPRTPVSSPVQPTVAIPLDATPALTFGGRLRSGELVSLWDQGQNHQLLDRVLVLDVLPVAASTAAKNNAAPFVIVLAIPVEHEAEVLALAAHNLIALTRVAPA